MGWDGQERRRFDRDCCSGEMRDRMRTVEVYMEGHKEKIGVLTLALNENNIKLQGVLDRLNEIKTQQRITHAIAAGIGTFIGACAELFAGGHWKL